MKFTIKKKLENNLGRAGILTTPHGVIETPAFVAVGTKGTVKSLTPEQIKSTGAEVVLANTYHLYLQPGDELVKAAGGLHKFMNWDGPLMTDSGGFQVFSLGIAYEYGISKFIASDSPAIEIVEEAYDTLRKNKKAHISEDGVKFQSIIDGSEHFLSPEKSIQIQNNIGADIIFAFDECTSPHATYEYLKEAMERTHRWAERSLIEHQKLENQKQSSFSGPRFSGSLPRPDHSPELVSDFPQAIFGIVQGGRYKDLREESARVVGAMDFDGFGIGGSFIKEDMNEAVKWVNTILPEGKPRHLLGVGEPEDLFSAIENGCDLFDCVAPTRIARNGALYTKEGKINILNAKYREDFSKIEEDCQCYTCNLSRPPLVKGGENPPDKGDLGGFYSRAYIAHLFRSKEMLAATLASIHNLYFIINLVKKIRQSILDDKFFEFKEEFLRNYKK